MTRKDMSDRFRRLLNQWPDDGEVLEALAVSAPLVRQERGGRYVLFVRAAIDQECTGWFLSDDPRGIVCMIEEDDHAELEGVSVVRRLRVVRRMARGRGLICTIKE